MGPLCPTAFDLWCLACAAGPVERSVEGVRRAGRVNRPRSPGPNRAGPGSVRSVAPLHGVSHRGSPSAGDVRRHAGVNPGSDQQRQASTGGVHGRTPPCGADSQRKYGPRSPTARVTASGSSALDTLIILDEPPLRSPGGFQHNAALDALRVPALTASRGAPVRGAKNADRGTDVLEGCTGAPTGNRLPCARERPPGGYGCRVADDYMPVCE